MQDLMEQLISSLKGESSWVQVLFAGADVTADTRFADDPEEMTVSPADAHEGGTCDWMVKKMMKAGKEANWYTVSQTCEKMKMSVTDSAIVAVASYDDSVPGVDHRPTCVADSLFQGESTCTCSHTYTSSHKDSMVVAVVIHLSMMNNRLILVSK